MNLLEISWHVILFSLRFMCAKTLTNRLQFFTHPKKYWG
jgi:hypothetical protein